MKKNLFILYFFLLFVAAWSQTAVFEKGYVITLKGDTIKGEIKRNPKKELEIYERVMIKISENEKKTFTPAKLKEFNISGQTYVAKKATDKGVFLKRVVHGYLNLYEWDYEDVDPSGEVIITVDFFYEKEGSNTTIKLKEGSKIKKQLMELFSDNKDIVTEIEKNKNLEMEQIIEAFSKYNSTKTP